MCINYFCNKKTFCYSLLVKPLWFIFVKKPVYWVVINKFTSIIVSTYPTQWCCGDLFMFISSSHQGKRHGLHPAQFASQSLGFKTFVKEKYMFIVSIFEEAKVALNLALTGMSKVWRRLTSVTLFLLQ